ncbi:MAG: DUF5063 domain-containing protein [Bacteroidota bacterium]|nr:DUF5063 domain-containing protein [Bacteroidota bacterium]
MSEEKKDNPVYSKHIIEMLTIANEYCLFIDKIESYKKSDIVNYMHKILPMMYLKGALLPAINVEDFSANEKFVNEMQWEKIFREIKNKMGDDDKFWIIRNTGLNKSEPQEASMGDHLADIYQDMKDFLLLYQQESIYAKQNAVNDLQKLFRKHWGERVLNATSAMHAMNFDETRTPFDSENTLNL